MENWQFPMLAAVRMQSGGELVFRFDALGPDTSGCFETWDGRVLPF